MSIISYITIPALAFLLSILDTSFLSFYEFYNATIISSFAALMIFAILGYRKESLVFGASCILSLSVFSSLPVWVLVSSFLLIPSLIFYIRDKIFFDNNIWAIAIIIFLSNLVFRLLMLSLTVTTGSELTNSVISFPILNLLFGIVFLVLAKKLLTYLKP